MANGNKYTCDIDNLCATINRAFDTHTSHTRIITQHFINRMIPLFLRRAITMAPALIILAIGLDPTRSLVISQVVLSFGIPFALVPLIMLTARQDVMGKGFENHRVTTVLASIFAAIIIALNLFLLFQTFTGA